MMGYFTFRKTADGSRDVLAVSRILLLICLVSFTSTRLHGQATPTASAGGDLQIGAMFIYGNSDYRPDNFKGYGFYTTFDFKYHIGIEGEFHQLNDPDATDGVYERTYEIGPRYVLHYGRYHPYAKLMYGRGVFNYPPVFGDPKTGPAANLAYNLGAIGAGVDYRVLPGMNVRADFEYQKWPSFPLNGLSPWIVSIGAAYRFH
jgi:opacity protein-like surface antigen